MARRRSRAGGTLVLLVALSVVGFVAVRNRAPRRAPAATEPKTRVVPGSGSSAGLERYGAPRGHESDTRRLRKTAFELSHDSRLKISRWVAYRAEGEDNSGRGRYAGDFFPERELAAGERAELTDYRGLWNVQKTGYDRGHQAPDATIRRFGIEAQRETYSLANITPQHSQINQGIWSDLEARIRGWSSSQNPVWVVTGPVFFARRETTRVGRNRVAVPHAYFCILDRGTRPEVQAFLIENTVEGPLNTELSRYLVSIDSVERLTGLDFLPDLPDTLEARLEAARPRAVWP